MAVSYLSHPYQSNPYVIPVDLGLLAKVNQYKQSQFYQNAEKINSQFAQLNTIDILNPEQHAHAKEVVNNLSQQVNQMGGLDLSDANVTNTLSGYTGSVYNDKTILNGIMSTKSIRNYQANSEKIKTDPKLSKYYDPAREWFDTQYDQNPNSINNYIKGGKDAMYSGPTAPTPSLGSDWDILTKEIQRINPTIEEHFDQSGNRFFIDKTTNKEVTASRIRQMVDGKIDGRVADQLNVHAAYNYYGLTSGKYNKEDGLKEFNSHNVNNFDRISKSIEALQLQIPQEGGDTPKRLQLEQDLQDLVDELPDAQKAVERGAKDFSDLWDKSPSAAFYNLYTNKLKDDISSVYSYKQTQRNLIVNQEALANARIDLEAMKLDAIAVRNADGTVTLKKKKKTPEEQAADEAAKMLSGDLTIDRSSTEDLNNQTVTQEHVKADIEATQNNINGELRNVIYETAKIANVPGLFDDAQSINNDPNANPISHSDLLKQIAQISGKDTQLEKSDIDQIVQRANKYGKFDGEGNFTFDKNNSLEIYNKNTKKSTVVLTAPQIQFFKNVQATMDAAANGEDITGKISNASSWRQFLNRYSIEQNAVINKQKLLKTAQDQVYNKVTEGKVFTRQEQEALKQYISDPSLYTPSQHYTGSYNDYYTGRSASDNTTVARTTPMESALNKITNYKGIQKMVDGLLNNTANRKNFFSIVLPDRTKDLEDQYPNITNYVIESSDFKSASIAKSKEDIDPRAVVTDGTNYFIKYGSKAKPGGDTGYAQISTDNLHVLGIGTVPYPSLEETVSQNGHLPQPIYIDPTATGNQFNKTNNFTGPIKIDLVNMNATGNRNDDNFTPAILYKGKEYYYKPGNSKSANVALQTIKSAIENNQSFTNIDDFITALNQYNQQ